ncbi:hypothetical protein K461DRAFT_282793 [Myriangium duriaei CBS 260.36]|uniref:Uncharacterized protein n=1 Tax=Myriangium duriaei CBS 260.36 TaxID=1168546 RepID=A0A9P4ITQ9_9PEZI|nr:hypothetical protein K461DRAFT_282793 [Myriangium duriaei CBS 260.36]
MKKVEGKRWKHLMWSDQYKNPKWAKKAAKKWEDAKGYAKKKVVKWRDKLEKKEKELKEAERKDDEKAIKKCNKKLKKYNRRLRRHIRRLSKRIGKAEKWSLKADPFGMSGNKTESKEMEPDQQVDYLNRKFKESEVKSKTVHGNQNRKRVVLEDRPAGDYWSSFHQSLTMHVDTLHGQLAHTRVGNESLLSILNASQTLQSVDENSHAFERPGKAVMDEADWVFEVAIGLTVEVLVGLVVTGCIWRTSIRHWLEKRGWMRKRVLDGSDAV